MSQSSWNECLTAAQLAGANLTASTTPTSLVPQQAKFTMPAGLLMTPGKTLEFTICGQISNIITTPGTFTPDIRFGSTVVINGGAQQLNAVAKTTVPFIIKWYATVRAVGSSANLMPFGFMISEAFVGSPTQAVGGAGVGMLPATTPAVGSNFDSTAAQTIDVFGTFSLNNANAVQLQLFTAKLIN